MLQQVKPHWTKYYPFTLDGVTRNTLCSGAAAPSGGGSCLLLGERRKLGGVQGALSRAALVAPAGAKFPLLEGRISKKNARGGHYDTPPLRSLFHTPYPAINRHKKTRPAVARRADFCYNGRRQEVLALPLASTREVSSHAPTVGLLYPFGGIKARVQTSQNGRIFMPIKDPEKKRAAQRERMKESRTDTQLCNGSLSGVGSCGFGWTGSMTTM